MAVLFDGVGSVYPPPNVTVAVLTIFPVAEPETVAETMYVTVALAGMETVSLMVPEPDALQVAPPVPEQVQVTLFKSAGIVSDKTPLAIIFPLLVTVIV